MPSFVLLNQNTTLTNNPVNSNSVTLKFLADFWSLLEW